MPATYTIKLTGITAPIKAELTAAGFHWDHDGRAWIKHNISCRDLFTYNVPIIAKVWPNVTITATLESEGQPP